MALTRPRTPTRCVRFEVLVPAVIALSCVSGRGSGRAVVAPTSVVAPTVSFGSLDAEALLREPSLRATVAGAGPLSIVAAGEAAERERLGGFVDIPEEACLLAYGRASRTVEDLDLAAFSDDGVAVAVDDAPDPHPTLLLCPPHARRLYLAAVVPSGEGLIAIGAQLVPVALSGAVGKLMSAHGLRSTSTRGTDGWPGLEDRVAKHEAVIGGTWEVFRKVAVAVDARMPAAVAFPIEADSCTDAVIVADDDVGGIDVEALDERGRLVARGTPDGRDRMLTVCSKFFGSGTLEVRPHAGQGLVAVVLARARGDVARDLEGRPDVAWVAATAPLSVARSLRESGLRNAGYAPASGSGEGVLNIGQVRSVSADLGARSGRGCARFDVIGGAPLALVAASTRDASGRLLTLAEGSAEATLFVCGGGAVRIDIEARARPGPFAALWRPERWNDVAFGVNPIAAARMLTRMLREGASTETFEGAALPSRSFQAAAGREVSWNEVVPAGDCLRVAVGSEGEGAGLVGRLIDAASGDDLDRAHAESAVALRGCASAVAPRALRLSIEVTAGKLDLVVGERLIP